MKILISGSHGLVGSALIPFLSTEGYKVTRMVRSKVQNADAEISWNPDSGEIDLKSLEGFDVVIHLAGENIADGKWTEERKKRIYESRVQGTRVLSEALSRLQNPPQLLITASAIGFYGDRPGEDLRENSAPGNGFLAKVCKDWESATLPAQKKGIRVVNARFGVILSAAGGALKKMLLPFRLGVGGTLGRGQQHMSWIALDDVVAGLYHVIHTPTLSGPVNFVSCLPVTNREFTKSLGKVLKRPTIFPIPEFAVKAAFGEMGEELLLSSQKVLPDKLQKSGYHYHFPDLKEALHHLLGK